MKVIYDSEVDISRILLFESKIAESDEDESGIIFDYDQNGAVVGIKILNASDRVDNPQSISYIIKHPAKL